jgi:hypothetical protein
MTNDNILSGLKVVDLASFKVEPPSGELWRHAHNLPPQPVAEDAYPWHLTNRNMAHVCAPSHNISETMMAKSTMNLHGSSDDRGLWTTAWRGNAGQKLTHIVTRALRAADMAVRRMADERRWATCGPARVVSMT